MKIALIGDIHANLPALEAVLAHAGQQGVEAIWNVGDFVGYGAFPDEVVQRVREAGAVSITGNYDLKVLNLELVKTKHAEKRTAFQWALDQLSPANRDYLRSLPQEWVVQVEGRRILMTHGSPALNEEHLTAATSAERLRELARLARADLVICGHSHQPFRRKVANTWFINTGSIGRPDDGDPRASYAILHLGPQILRVRHFRVAYDVERAAAAIRQNGLPETFAQMIVEGRNLEGVKSAHKERGIESAESSRRLQDDRIKAVLQLAESCDYEAGHTHQVTHLALQLFDELQALHQLGEEERFWLRCAGLLHDIGWVEGQKGHHKTALRLILEAPLLLFNTRERLIIGSIARYHRKALPDEAHDHYAALQPSDRQTVCVLAGLLRVADGLDRTHASAVRNLACEITSHRIVVRCEVQHPAEAEQQTALDKGELFEQVFERRLAIDWNTA
jgi:putative phosphoesterase